MNEHGHPGYDRPLPAPSLCSECGVNPVQRGQDECATCKPPSTVIRADRGLLLGTGIRVDRDVANVGHNRWHVTVRIDGRLFYSSRTYGDRGQIDAAVEQTESSIARIIRKC